MFESYFSDKTHKIDRSYWFMWEPVTKQDEDARESNRKVAALSQIGSNIEELVQANLAKQEAEKNAS